jgi:hypothetical protein
VGVSIISCYYLFFQETTFWNKLSSEEGQKLNEGHFFVMIFLAFLAPLLPPTVSLAALVQEKLEKSSQKSGLHSVFGLLHWIICSKKWFLGRINNNKK